MLFLWFILNPWSKCLSFSICEWIFGTHIGYKLWFLFHFIVNKWMLLFLLTVELRSILLIKHFYLSILISILCICQTGFRKVSLCLINTILIFKIWCITLSFPFSSSCFFSTPSLFKKIFLISFPSQVFYHFTRASGEVSYRNRPRTRRFTPNLGKPTTQECFHVSPKG
jgi:hypothetical protein